eukprot:3595687-Alexandrium_andersonii.AAC.1
MNPCSAPRCITAEGRRLSGRLLGRRCRSPPTAPAPRLAATRCLGSPSSCRAATDNGLGARGAGRTQS